MAFGGLLHNSTSSANYLPIVKYDARSGRIMRRDRANGETTEVDITRSFKAVIDTENAEVGWGNFGTGGAPDLRLSRYGDSEMAPKPGPDFRITVRYIMKLSKECGGDIRELASNANATLEGIDKLQDEYNAGVKENPGKLPVIILKDSIAKTSGEGQKRSTNYVPVFEIVQWVKRPDDLVYQPRNSSAASDAPTSSAPPATGSTKVSAPVAVSDDEDFG